MLCFSRTVDETHVKLHLKRTYSIYKIYIYSINTNRLCLYNLKLDFFTFSEMSTPLKSYTVVLWRSTEIKLFLYQHTLSLHTHLIRTMHVSSNHSGRCFWGLINGLAVAFTLLGLWCHASCCTQPGNLNITAFVLLVTTPKQLSSTRSSLGHQQIQQAWKNNTSLFANYLRSLFSTYRGVRTRKA